MTGNNGDKDDGEDDEDDAGVIILAKGMEQESYIKTEVRGCLPPLILCLLTRYGHLPCRQFLGTASVVLD